MHYISTDLEGDVKGHLIFNAERLQNAVVTTAITKQNNDNATSKAKEISTSKYFFTFDIEGQKTTIEVHDRLAFNNDLTAMFGSKYSKMLTKNQVVGEQFYTKISSIYPNLTIRS